MRLCGEPGTREPHLGRAFGKPNAALEPETKTRALRLPQNALQAPSRSPLPPSLESRGRKPADTGTLHFRTGASGESHYVVRRSFLVCKRRGWRWEGGIRVQRAWGGGSLVSTSVLSVACWKVMLDRRMKTTEKRQGKGDEWAPGS